jgi:hypothetical protein
MEDDMPAPPDHPEPERQSVPPHHLTRRQAADRKKRLLFIAGGAVLLLLLAGAGYWLFLRDKSPAQTQTAGNAQGQNQQAEEVPVTPADSTPVSFKSTKLNIELTHRKDWTLKEGSDGEVTITSPRISYARSDGKAATGVFTVKVRKGVPEAMQTTIEKAVAARNSEVIAYAAPTDQQRQYTNLSYAGQKDIFNFFVVTGNTDLKAGNAFAYTLQMDADFYLIVGGYGSDPGNTLAFDAVPAVSMDSTALEQAIDIVESLKIY